MTMARFRICCGGTSSCLAGVAAAPWQRHNPTHDLATFFSLRNRVAVAALQPLLRRSNYADELRLSRATPLGGVLARDVVALQHLPGLGGVSASPSAYKFRNIRARLTGASVRLTGGQEMFDRYSPVAVVAAVGAAVVAANVVNAQANSTPAQRLAAVANQGQAAINSVVAALLGEGNSLASLAVALSGAGVATDEAAIALVAANVRPADAINALVAAAPQADKEAVRAVATAAVDPAGAGNPVPPVGGGGVPTGAAGGAPFTGSTGGGGGGGGTASRS